MKRRRSRSTTRSDFKKSNDENAATMPDAVISLILPYINFRDLCNLELASKNFRFHCLRHYRNLKYVDFCGNRPPSIISRSAFNALIDKMKIYAPNLHQILRLSLIADRFTCQNLSKLVNFSKLNRMDFFRVDVDCAGFNNFIGSATNLRHLSLICVNTKNYNDEDFSINVNLPNLEVLEVACLSFCKCFLRSLCCTKLRVFRITEQNNETCPVDVLERTLSRNLNLEHINLKDIQFFDYLKCIGSLPKLKRLFIDGQETSMFGTNWLVPRDLFENPDFDEFKMNFEISFSEWSVFLPVNSCSLTVLKYSKNLRRFGFHVFHKGMDAIWSQLAVKNSLETIFISQRCLMAYPIFGILRQLPNLKELVLFNVILLEKDVECLSNFDCLTRLEFKNARNANLVNIVRYLPKSLTIFTYCRALLELYSITDSTMIILINRCPNLEILSLSSLNVTKLTFREIQRKLKHLRVMRMNFDGLRIATPKLVNRLASDIVDHLIPKISSLRCVVVNGGVFQRMIQDDNISLLIRLRNLKLFPWSDIKFDRSRFDEFGESLFAF